MKTMCSKKSVRNVIRWAAVTGLAVAVAGAGAMLLDTPVQAQAPAAAAGAAPADMKPFADKLPGTEIQVDMVPIPGGKVKLGSPETEKKRKADEGPQFEVEVEPFYMGKYEVTWELYNEFLDNYKLLGNDPTAKPVPMERLADAVSYPTPIYDLDAGPRLQRMGGQQGPFPAVIMSHFAAKQFCKWLSAKTGRFYRLPTEAEWEFAARGGKETAYFFGDDAKQLGDYAWFADNAELKDGDVGYHQVGQKKPNPYGLYDIYGNVAEIVQDQYDPEHYKQFAGKSVGYRDAVRWPDKQYPRVVKGGGFESDVEDCRTAARKRITVAANTQDPQRPKSPYWWTEGFSIGFRVVSPVKEPTPEEKKKYWDVDNETVLDILPRGTEIRQLVDDIKAQTKPAAK